MLDSFANTVTFPTRVTCTVFEEVGVCCFNSFYFVAVATTERYKEEHGKEPGTYYLTKGWIDEGKSPLGIFAEYTQRYGKKTAEWVIREELKNYKRIALVHSGNGLPDEYQAHARENAQFLNLRYEEIAGSLNYFVRMLGGAWGKDFIILKPGQEVKQEFFFEEGTL